MLNIIFFTYHFDNNSGTHYLAEYRSKMTITVWLKKICPKCHKFQAGVFHDNHLS